MTFYKENDSFVCYSWDQTRENTGAFNSFLYERIINFLGILNGPLNYIIESSRRPDLDVKVKMHGGTFLFLAEEEEL